MTQGGGTTLSGWVDVAQRDRVAGWATRGGARDPVALSLWVAKTARQPRRLLATILANGYRPDHDPQATLYRGRVGFDADLREFDLPAGSFLLDVAETATGMRLPGAPLFVPSADFAPPPARLLPWQVDGRLVCRLPRDVIPVLPVGNGTLAVMLPAGAAGLMIGTPTRQYPGDARRLGACVSAVTLDGVPLDLASDAFLFGFHACEGEPGRKWRWTAEAAFIGIGAGAQPSEIALRLDGIEAASGHTPAAATWRLTAAFRPAPEGCAALPYVGQHFLGPPRAPPHRTAARRYSGAGLASGFDLSTT